MPVNNDYLNYVLEQLRGLGQLSSRRMFSGVGFYCDDIFFGLIYRGTLYFKVDDSTRADYESRGMARFQPYADKPILSRSYYEVPADVLEDSEQLIAWAKRSVAAALTSPKRRAKRLRLKTRGGTPAAPKKRTTRSRPVR